MKQIQSSNKPSSALILLGIAYACLIIIAVWTSLEYKADFSFKVSAICALIATGLFFPISSILKEDDKEKNTEDEQANNKYHRLWLHLVLWTAIIFLPFGDYPKPSLFGILLLVISEVTYLSYMTKSENKDRSRKSKSSMASLTGTIAMIVIGVVIVLYVLTTYGYDKKISKWYQTTITNMERNKKTLEQDKTVVAEPTTDEQKSSKKLTATFRKWSDPLNFKISSVFTTEVDGEIDPNSTGNDAVNIVIYLSNGNGNIILNNGVVEYADSRSSECSGTWFEQGSGNSGTYNMKNITVSGAMLQLYHNGTEVALIDLNVN